MEKIHSSYGLLGRTVATVRPPTLQVCSVYNYPNLVSSQHVEEVWPKKASGAAIHKVKFIFLVHCGNLFNSAIHCQGDQLPSLLSTRQLKDTASCKTTSQGRQLGSHVSLRRYARIPKPLIFFVNLFGWIKCITLSWNICFGVIKTRAVVKIIISATATDL